jgi:hypothetical protein
MPIPTPAAATLDLHHVGVIVRDMDAAARDNVARCGLGSLVRRSTMRFDNALYRGERITYSAEFAFHDLGNTAIELIQPIGNDRSPYLDALNESGECTHHLACFVPSIDAHLDAARRSNPALSVLVESATPDGRIRFVYVEGLVRGVLMELMERRG